MSALPEQDDRREALERVLRSTDQQAVTVVEVLDGDVPTLVLPAVEGEVMVDRTTPHRRACTVTVTDPDGRLVPNHPDHPLAPFGNRLRVRRGVMLDDGDPVHATLGPGSWLLEEGFTTGPHGGLVLDFAS